MQSAAELYKQYIEQQKMKEEENRYRELSSHVKKIEISRSTCAVVIYADRKLKSKEIDEIMKRVQEVLLCPCGHKLVYFPAIGRYWCQICKEAFHEVKCVYPNFAEGFAQSE